jgi:hypothetical protein
MEVRAFSDSYPQLAYSQPRAQMSCWQRKGPDGLIVGAEYYARFLGTLSGRQFEERPVHLCEAERVRVPSSRMEGRIVSGAFMGTPASGSKWD